VETGLQSLTTLLATTSSTSTTTTDKSDDIREMLWTNVRLDVVARVKLAAAATPHALIDGLPLTAAGLLQFTHTHTHTHTHICVKCITCLYECTSLTTAITLSCCWMVLLSVRKISHSRTYLKLAFLPGTSRFLENLNFFYRTSISGACIRAEILGVATAHSGFIASELFCHGTKGTIPDIN